MFDILISWYGWIQSASTYDLQTAVLEGSTDRSHKTGNLISLRRSLLDSALTLVLSTSLQ